MTVLALATLPAGQITEASGVFTLVRNFGSSLFISLSIVLLVRSTLTNYSRMLEFINPFTLLIAVVLSAQTTDAGVNKATRELFPIADTPQKILALGETNLRERFKSLGFFNTKAKNVIALCEQLIAKYDGRVPRRREELEALPGVGRKTANVVLNVAFARPTIAVDTHVFRVSNRIPLAIGATPLEVELGLEKIIPDEFKTHTHHWLILHGRYTCKARRPECERCIIPDLCRSPEKRV